MLARVAKPVVVCCPGAPRPAAARPRWVATLDDAAEAAVRLLPGPAPPRGEDRDRVRGRLEALGGPRVFAGRRVLGLYTGGTLAAEARAVLEPLLGPIASRRGSDGGHAVIDLGEDVYTRGRPHPMLDP
jgi:FdrA protein